MAAKHEQRHVFVYGDWTELGKPELLGVLTSSLIRGKEIFSFEYSNDWLKSGKAQNIDPNLQLYSGSQYLGEEKSSFGIYRN